VPDRFDRGESAAEANPSASGTVPRDPLDRTPADFGGLTGATRRADADAATGLRDPLDTRTGIGLASRTDLEPVAAGAATGASQSGTQEDIDQPRDATPRPTPRFETPDPRPRPRPDIEGLDPDADDEDPRFGTDADGDLFGSGIASAEEIGEDIFNVEPDRFGF